ncbi:transglutaminase-like domain-containing protein [Noviherbaspirillum sp. UKPF54]|uniref:transglutaminase-like domain-containing protein n=1 Tax=Noviherbaspirillum sp. UKPF54 TaxID=2601898 RepID=UPI0011B12B02|nr:transglutaminase domain-containing protein [Noviherbaspirillum sp. UKPF54]QDZ27889.1 transglutaminase domain-containing protein [Noviherbaspirillum sp. UKPF54]
MQNSKPNAITRRSLLKAASGALLAAALPQAALAQQREERRFAPQPGDWRSFEVVTRVDLQKNGVPAKVWVPLPSVETAWQRSLSDEWSGNGKSMRVVTDGRYGAKYLAAEFDGTAPAVLEVRSRVQTRDRATDWEKPAAAHETPDDLRSWLQPTDLMPLDGIVHRTARQIVAGARTDLDKVQRIYDWIIISTYREPKVRGCGVGDIKAMLESGNLSGKCGDINGLFVGLCRAAGVPARDAYGIRLAPSAFGYRELGGNPASLKGAQHCRAEVYLRKHGWVAMDPADVGKVMRLETGTWIKDPDHPVVAPVRKALFGGWEGNWMAYNFAHDVALRGSTTGKIGFFMYPQAEIAGEALDPLEPDAFKYAISARAVTA